MSKAPGTEDIFVRGVDGEQWTRSFNGTTWTAWTPRRDGLTYWRRTLARRRRAAIAARRLASTRSNLAPRQHHCLRSVVE